MVSLAAVFLVAEAVSAGASIIGANAKKHAADDQAKQLRQQAGENIGQALQVGEQKREEADLLASDALASAGMTGTTGPNITRTLSDIKARGSFNALSALYSGQSLAAQQRKKAAAMQKQARQERNATVLKSITSTAMSGLSFYDTYALTPDMLNKPEIIRDSTPGKQ